MMVFKTWLHFSDNGSQVRTHQPNLNFIIQSLFFFQQFFFIFIGLLQEHHTDVNKVTVVQS